MSHIIVLAREGADDLWMVDLEAGSVAKLDGARAADFGLKDDGAPLVRGVSLAVAAAIRPETASWQLSPAV